MKTEIETTSLKAEPQTPDDLADSPFAKYFNAFEPSPDEAKTPTPLPRHPLSSGHFELAVPELQEIQTTQRLNELKAGQLALVSPKHNFIKYAGSSDPRRGHHGLLGFEFDEDWHSQEVDANPHCFDASFMVLNIPDWLEAGVLSELKNIYQTVRVCILAQGRTMNGAPTYKIIETMDEEEARCHILVNASQGISTASVFLYVWDHKINLPQQDMLLNYICSKHCLNPILDTENYRVIIF